MMRLTVALGWLAPAMLCTSVWAEAQMAQNEFFTNYPGEQTYRNNLRQEATLSVPGATALEVRISGVTEAKYDILRVYNEKMREVKRLQGDFKNLPAFIVPGSSIKVTFNSDGRKVASGATVKVTAASPAGPFREIKEKVLKLVDAITTNGATQANAEIARNITLFENLRNQFEQDRTQAVKTLADNLLTVAEAYARVAGMHNSIMSGNRQSLDELRKLQKETLFHRNQVQDWKYSEEAELAQLMADIANTGEALERRRKEISIATRKSIITSLDAQTRIWQGFYDTQGLLVEKLQVFGDKLSLLLYTLEMNAQVYRQAATVLQLDRNMLPALQALDTLAALESVLADIEQSWQTVEELRRQIEQTNFQ
jgi:hypothetical protein